ncbi:hypothetical protein NL108_001116 [Boleophthalmus pectinirostris]|nr:hypothetical protein NL108_001116 [Boleophthalmus pectinirostris]
MLANATEESVIHRPSVRKSLATLSLPEESGFEPSVVLYPPMTCTMDTTEMSTEIAWPPTNPVTSPGEPNISNEKTAIQGAVEIVWDEPKEENLLCTCFGLSLFKPVLNFFTSPFCLFSGGNKKDLRGKIQDV